MDRPAGTAPDLIVRRADPFNAEPVPARLVASFLTPVPDFFVRNHGPIPALTADHRIAVAGLVDRPRALSMSELHEQFPTHTVTATIQCAGNRRAHLQGVAPTKGDPWDVAAIGTAEWTGVALADVLAATGVQAAAAHVVFAAADLAAGGGTVAPYEVSIPLRNAAARGVLLAWAMNGAPLIPAHGFPLRVVVPGNAGVRSVKWLTRIALSATPSAAPMNALEYKRFAASVTAETADWAAAPSINEMPVNSAICQPGAGDRLAPGRVKISGWAMAYAGVARVELSSDGGATWRRAELVRGPDRDSWVQWHATPTLTAGTHELVVRAFDRAGGVQPKRPEEAWNFKGYLSTAWHRMTVTVG